MTALHATIGEYRFVARIDEGGMGAVYRAVHQTLGHEVAIKILPANLVDDPAAQGWFRRGAASAAALQHPNILPVYGYGEHEGAPYLVMPYIKGGTLKDRMATGNLSQTEIVGYLRQLAAALDCAHDQGVIHRDVKPANLLLDERGHLYLADFGIARVLESATRYTRTGAAIGTPDYMAPEQARGQADHRSDIYAAGIILYQLLAGQVPFGGTSAVAIMLRHVQDPLPLAPLRQCQPAAPPALERVIQKALAKDPDERYQRASALADAVAAAFAGAPVAADYPTTIAHPAPAGGTAPPPRAIAPTPPPWSGNVAPRRSRSHTPLIAALSAALVILLILSSGYVAWDWLGDRASASSNTATQVVGQVAPTIAATATTSPPAPATAPTLAATAPPLPTATRTPTPPSTRPLGTQPSGWRTYLGTPQTPFAIYYPGDWTADLSQERAGSVTFWAPNKTASLRIATLGKAEAGSNLDQLRDQQLDAEIDLCRQYNCQIGSVQRTGYDTLNPRFAWFLTTITYANGVVGDLRDGIALKGDTLWVYNVVIQRNDRNDAQDLLDIMAPSLNIYANP